jgi:epoxyqueuosine reductase QueG
MTITEFFRNERGIEFSVSSIDSFDDNGRTEVRKYLPDCRSAIVFGEEVPYPVFSLQTKLQTYVAEKTVKRLDNLAFELSRQLTAEGNFSVPVVAYAPINVHNGKLSGLLSIKHLAVQSGLGEMGLNAVLMTPRSGNRILLSGVLCSQPLTPVNNSKKKLCTNCRKCIQACPSQAVTENHVDMFRCKNLTGMIPFFLIPFVKFLFRLKALEKYLEILITTFAANGEMVCCRCITACPRFVAGCGYKHL